MAVNEQISTGRFYRRLINETSKLWERISFWNKASDTECNDGQTVETKIGAFKGVTTSTNVTTTGFAADAKIVSKLNSNLGGLQFRNNNSSIEWKVEGADTWRPFNGLSNISCLGTMYISVSKYKSANITIINSESNFTKSAEILHVDKLYDPYNGITNVNVIKEFLKTNLIVGAKQEITLDITDVDYIKTIGDVYFYIKFS